MTEVIKQQVGRARNACRVIIDGLNPETDADELHDFFSLFGVVVDAGVSKDKWSDQGFVEFADPDTAAVVNKQRNLIFNNQIIEVRRPKSTRCITHKHPTKNNSSHRGGSSGKTSSSKVGNKIRRRTQSVK